MPRPQPVIIPGPTGMGGSWSKSDTNLQLDKLAALFGFIQDQRAKSAQAENELASGEAMVNLAGQSGAFPKTSEQGPTNYAPLGKSKEGRDFLSSLLGPKNRHAEAAPKIEHNILNKEGVPTSYQILPDGTMRELGPTFNNKGAESNPKIEHNIIGEDGKPHSWQVLPDGTKKDLGLTFNKMAGGGQSSDEFYSNLLQKVAAGEKITDSQKRALSVYMEVKRSTAPIPGIIDPTEKVLERLFPQVTKPEAKGVFTPAIAGEYLKKYKTRAEAEAAAKKDGYKW